MSDVDEKLIIRLGQRISEQNEILRVIAASLQGVESNLRQMTVSSNPAPNYQRALSKYPRKALKNYSISARGNRRSTLCLHLLTHPSRDKCLFLDDFRP
jgi:hypothetical protein